MGLLRSRPVSWTQSCDQQVPVRHRERSTKERSLLLPNYISGLPHLFYLLWPLSHQNSPSGVIASQETGPQAQNTFYKRQTPKARGIIFREDVAQMVQNSYNIILIAGTSHYITLSPRPTTSQVKSGRWRLQFWKDSSLRPPFLVRLVVSPRPQMEGA
jgi:hypothetical protein